MKTKIIYSILAVIMSSALLGFETATLKGSVENPGSKNLKIDKEPGTSDQNINSRVAQTLYGDKFFSPEVIQIESKGGVVTLTGVVDSLRSRDQAVSLTEGVSGVVAVIDELKLRDFYLNDGQIFKEVSRALGLDAATAPHKFEIKVSRGVVELHGTVTSWAEKSLAAWAIKGVKGVIAINNRIGVVNGASRDNQEIKADVVALLHRDPFIRDDLLQVRVQDRVVTVSGQVATIAQERRIYEAALVSGVTGVNLTGIRVEPTLNNERAVKKPPQNDDEIQVAAKNALALDPRLKGLKLNVDVNNYIATLSGKMRNLKARFAANTDLEDTVGVAAVEDKTDLLFKRPRSDSEILKDVGDVFDLDPELYNQGIKVKVTHGRVTLTGVTRSVYQRWLAGDMAAHVDGVSEINNQLSILKSGNAEPLKKDDIFIKNSILATIRDDSQLNPLDIINVKVKGEQTVLTGKVFSWPEFTRVTEDAFNCGSKNVVNKLRVIGRLSHKLKIYSEMPSEIYSLPAWRPGDMDEGAFKTPTEANKK